jgi:hypothetical protein
LFYYSIQNRGIKAVDKKEGAGKGNWGTAVDELAAELEFFLIIIIFKKYFHFFKAFKFNFDA